MKYKLSIIVPIFNVEEYICRCAESLLKQTASGNDYEVVFVNDGTKDNSVGVLKKYIDFDRARNFMLVHKENGGLSSARNYGVEHCSGDYLWFVDSDDWIEPNSVATILGLAESNPDIIFTSQMFKNVGDSQTLKYRKSINIIAKGVDILKQAPPSCSVAYICKREFMDAHNFRFKEGILYEDSELTPKMLYTADRVVVTNIPLYHHFMREGSITHSLNQRSISDFTVVLKSHVCFFENNVEKRYKKHYASDISPKIIELLDYSMLLAGKRNKEVDELFCKNRSLIKILLLSNHRLSSLLGVLLMIFPCRTTSIFFLINTLFRRKVSYN